MSKKKRKGLNSRAKGNAGELEIVRLLSTWWEGVDHSRTPAKDLPFARSPRSGGWATTHRRMSAVVGFQRGDIVSAHPEFPFCVEVKRRDSQNVPFQNVLKPKAAWPVLDWWDQVLVDASETEASVHPLLLIRQNHEPWFAMIREGLFNLLFEDATFPPHMVIRIDAYHRYTIFLLEFLLALDKDFVLDKTAWAIDLEETISYNRVCRNPEVLRPFDKVLTNRPKRGNKYSN